MNGSEGIGRGGGEDGVQANSSLGALPSSTAFLGGGGNGNGGPFQLPNGLTRQDSFGTSLAGGAMHGAMHPMLRQDSFARLNAANLAFSGGALGNAVGNAVGHGGLGDQSSMGGAMGGAMPSISSMGKQNALDASVSSVFSSSSGGGPPPPFRQNSASQLSNNLASHVMGEPGAESGLWRAMNQALRQDSSSGLSLAGGALAVHRSLSLSLLACLSLLARLARLSLLALLARLSLLALSALLVFLFRAPP